MPTTSLSGFRTGIILILLAALAMGLLAWRGLENHRKLVWSEARDEAAEVADRFEKNLEREVREIRFYDYPPRPGSFEFSSGATMEELRGQMDLDSRTTAGLPVAVLAAYEVARRTGSVRDGELARDLAMTRWPDLTSPLILERLALLAEEHSWEGDFSNWKNRWQSDESARDLIRDSENDGWFSREGQLFRVEKLGELEFSYLEISPNLTVSRNFRLQLILGDFQLWKTGKVLLSRPLQNATLVVDVPDTAALEKEWRSRRDGTLFLLGLAALVIAAGVAMMSRGIMKEKKAVHARSQFVASVTHELRAPVGSMRLMADALEGGKLASKKEEEFHRLMARESGRLSVLIENVMDLAKVEDGKRAVFREEISLPELIDEVCEMMALPASEKEVTFSKKGLALSVEADAVMIRQVLVNLLDNAIKFSPGGGKVFITWKSGWGFAVTDQGPGIPAEDRERVFERFYRREDELRRKTQGVGIGLSLVKELVTLHGGVVKVAHDEGAVFRVEFNER